MDDENAQYQRDSGRKTLVSYGSSSALAKEVEIENGAPADIFWSSDLDCMDYLEERKLVKSENRLNILGSKLVLIAPVFSRINLTISPNFPLAQALGNDRLAMADPTAVPAGNYGKAALEALGVWSSVLDKIAPATMFVRGWLWSRVAKRRLASSTRPMRWLISASKSGNVPGINASSYHFPNRDYGDLH